jgi:hypothetical protein
MLPDRSRVGRIRQVHSTFAQETPEFIGPHAA